MPPADPQLRRQFNDALRKNDSGGTILFSLGIVNRGSKFVDTVRRAVADHEPTGEDEEADDCGFGCVLVGGEKIVWGTVWCNEKLSPSLTMSADSVDGTEREHLVLLVVLESEQPVRDLTQVARTSDLPADGRMLRSRIRSLSVIVGRAVGRIRFWRRKH